MSNKKRIIIQFQLDPKGKIIALANDGSLWVKHDEWFRIAPLPEPVSDEEEES